MKGKGFIKPLLLLAVVLILTAIAYWDEKQTVADKKVADSKNRFLTFQVSDIQSLRLEKAGSPPVQIEKGDKGWAIREPLSYPADSEGIGRLLKTVGDLQFEKEFPAKNLKDYGLDQPQIRLVLKDGKESWDLQIGSKSPTGFSSYVRLNDADNVYLVSHYVFTATNKELYDFRDKSMQVPAIAELNGFSYQWQGEAGIRLTKTGDKWFLEEPLKHLADRGEIMHFLEVLNRQKVLSFIDSPDPALLKALTETGKGTARILSVTLSKVNGQSQIMEIVENNGRLYTKLPYAGSFAELDLKVKDELHKSAADFQDRSMMSYVATDVSSVDIDGQEYVLENQAWVKAKDKARADFVRGLVTDLEFAKADVVFTAEEAERVAKGPPQHSISFTFKDGRSTRISLWKVSDKPDAFVVKTGDNRFFQAKADLFQAMRSQNTESPELGLGAQPKSKS